VSSVADDDGAVDRTPVQRLAPGQRADPGSRGRILVVDDESAVRMVLARALATCGYEVFLADSGADALFQLGRQRPFDAVVSDVDMPVMTGPRLAAELLQHYPGLPILFVTAAPVPPELLAHPLIELLAKPPGTAVLRNMLEELIRLAAKAGPPAA
jgi:CheY-like chemotaxis protein